MSSPKSIYEDPQFRLAIAIPALSFIASGAAILSNSDLDLSLTYDGFNTFLQIFKFPLGCLALAVPLIALAVTNFRTIQTERQILAQQSQNNFVNYFKHIEEYEKYLDSISEKIKVDHNQILIYTNPCSHAGSAIQNFHPAAFLNSLDKRTFHDRIFSDAKKGILLISEEFKKSCNEGLGNLTQGLLKLSSLPFEEKLTWNKETQESCEKFNETLSFYFPELSKFNGPSKVSATHWDTPLANEYHLHLSTEIRRLEALVQLSNTFTGSHQNIKNFHFLHYFQVYYDLISPTIKIENEIDSFAKYVVKNRAHIYAQPDARKVFLDRYSKFDSETKKLIKTNCSGIIRALLPDDMQ